MPKKVIKNQSGGYTIIETMIAVSLFVLIVTLGMGTLLNANGLHLKSKNMRSILDNLSFIMEDVSRNLRTGNNYHCILSGDSALPDPLTTKSCEEDEGSIGIAFMSEDGDTWVYYVQEDVIYKSTDGLATVVPLTPGEVTVESFSFIVEGAEPPPGDTLQPLVNIRIMGNITTKGVVSPFTLQTSVSQRSIDI